MKHIEELNQLAKLLEPIAQKAAVGALTREEYDAVNELHRIIHRALKVHEWIFPFNLKGTGDGMPV
jgi:hypothetical protein